MKRLLVLLCLLTFGWAQPLRANGSVQPILILVSIDGCRWDYVQKFAPPTLTALAAHGVSAEKMLSCFPSKTFPNHYSIATGLRPENHGIIGNSIYDPSLEATFTLRNGGPEQSRWWGGEPIWVTAERQGLRSACMFWPGSEAVIKGMRPSTWLPYQYSLTCDERVDHVLTWLQRPEDERPQLITLYFDVVDTAGHTFGPDSPEVRDALAKVDAALAKLQAGVRALGLESRVDYLITSDHGMTGISNQRRIALDDFVDPATVQIDAQGTLMGLRPLHETPEQLLARFAGIHPHFRAYLREDIPERFHYSHNLRIPPVVLIADLGWSLDTKAGFAKEDKNGWDDGGAHGYDPAEPDMGATFIASGPTFRSGKVIPPFENIHLYDLMCTILGIQPAPNDGDHRLAHQVLKAD